MERRRSTSSKIATDDSMAETQDNMSAIGTEDRDHYRENEGIIDVLNPSSDLLHCADNCTGLRRGRGYDTQPRPHANPLIGTYQYNPTLSPRDIAVESAQLNQPVPGSKHPERFFIFCDE